MYLKEQKIEFVENIDLNAGYKVFKNINLQRKFSRMCLVFIFNAYIY